MPHKIKAVDEAGNDETLRVDRFPDRCPDCKTAVNPKPLMGHFIDNDGSNLHIAFICPSAHCNMMFVGTYRRKYRGTKWDTWQYFDTSLLRQTRDISFQKSIQAISKSFCEIFSQACIADDNGLHEIAGAGYRKALEFLVKDYLIGHKFNGDEGKQTEIKETALGSCINSFLDEGHIKECAKRAAWLGNDNTHYYKEWKDKDIKDLKALISMTVNWVDLNIQSDSYKKDMAPTPKRKKKS